MRVYTHPACLAHDTGPDHAERPARLSAVTDALRTGLPALDWHEAPRATRGQLLRAHAPDLLEAVLETHPAQRILLDPDTVLSPASADAALRAAGAAVAAVDAVLSGKTRRAFCAVRPPGHHATRDAAMGFCLFNNIAVAALHALDKHGLERVAIVDFDVHHGNGTQAIFERDQRVLFASSHQWPLYPETGAATRSAWATSSMHRCRSRPRASCSAGHGKTCCCPRCTTSARNCCWCRPVSTRTGGIRLPSCACRRATTPGSPTNSSRWRTAIAADVSSPAWKAATT